MKLRYMAGVVGLCCSMACLADLRPQSAAQLCTALNDTQLRANEWTARKDGQEGCSSGARPVKADRVDGNTISFSAEGAEGIPRRVKLVLNVVLPSDEDAARRELIKATKRLSVRALGLSIPHAFDEAILKGTPINLAVGDGHASLTRTVVNKQNYVLSVVME
ncbi:DUF6030 family protein [Pseudomonas sp. GD03842]|uniref:DUF6030 family protein n=1 Tax=Pseudomonas sp. GD03842 TaxID=2975385 RepID=UPI00244C5763|nr:DUF6030 family protein [Pseudomonas sp. GD03842]MDH0747833.1 DUF6030 family protein [Pseudomonas sp. GD03842]